MVVAGTGHRPQFCPCKFNDNHPWLISLKQRLTKYLKDEDVSLVISGAAIGFDTWLAECAIDANIPFHLYIPFVGQASKWPKESQDKYNFLKEKAQKCLYISEEYSKEAFFKRDRAMIDNADSVVSLLNPEASSGGTYYTVMYAKGAGKNVVNFWV